MLLGSQIQQYILIPSQVMKKTLQAIAEWLGRDSMVHEKGYAPSLEFWSWQGHLNLANSNEI